jgi:hypothetical protein
MSCNFCFFFTYKTLAIHGNLYSCSVATSARGKQEEIQKRGTHKEREGGMGNWCLGFTKLTPPEQLRN